MEANSSGQQHQLISDSLLEQCTMTELLPERVKSLLTQTNSTLQMLFITRTIAIAMFINPALAMPKA